jgi:hypothetical protein
METMKSMVSHIHLDKHTWFNLSIKVISCGALLFIFFDSDCVHIYVNKLI